MNLVFNKIYLHNFGSYGQEELDITNKGYCLVTGENHCKLDNAISNGSGKSFLWSAICYAITGETIQGISSNLKNINIPDDPDCFVKLEFSVDKDNYIITRYHKPKSDLKIELNGTDISGKGIKESEIILKDRLPDLTKNLIASTILLGQGMPNKFSSFSPSGRKELLEKLTKSDYMIEDIKNRITNRLNDLNSQLRLQEDTKLATQTQINMLSQQLSQVTTSLNSLVKPDFDAELLKTETELNQALGTEKSLNTAIADTEAKIEKANTELLETTNLKNTEIIKLNESYNSSAATLMTDIANYKATITALKNEIARLQSIKDTCPTCGQKIPGIVKQDTSNQEAELQIVINNLNTANITLQTKKDKLAQYTTDINTQFNTKINIINTEVLKDKNNLNVIKGQLSDTLSLKTRLENTINQINFEKTNFDSHVKTLKDKKTELETKMAESTSLGNTIDLTITDLSEKLAVVKKMDTFAKRDFRGYLLLDVITYLDKKAKEYCKIIFNTEELAIKLNGNSLDISYCSKPLENLSGGEHQKVDLILQFAIRDLLSVYFNYSSNIIVLDEVVDFLDKTGCDAVMELINTKLSNIDSVFIISHHADSLPLTIDSEIKIYKNELGVSSIIS